MRQEGSIDIARPIERSHVKDKGFTKVMFLLFGWLMKKSSCDALEKELASLERYVEAA